MGKETDRFMRVFQEVEQRVSKWPEWQREMLTQQSPTGQTPLAADRKTNSNRSKPYSPRS